MGVPIIIPPDFCFGLLDFDRTSPELNVTISVIPG
jgi:hypothetical protein